MNSNNKLRIGFVGLGLMGQRMAGNILKANFPLAVYNRTRSKTEAFRTMGCEVAENPASLARKVDVIITMVTGPKDVEEVYLGKEGVVHGARRGLIALDMSTIGPETAIRVGKALSEYGLHYLDAPVTGGLKGAAEATLTVFVGGDQNILERVEKIILTMAKKIQYMGALGSGQAVKLVNNLITAETLIVLSEAIIFAEGMNLSRKKVAAVLQDVPALSLFMNQRLPDIANNSYPARFTLKNMYKDVSLAIEELRQNKSLWRKLPYSRLARDVYAKALEKGYGDEDFSAVFKAVE